MILNFLIRHRKLTIILISVGEGEGDDVVPSEGQVGLQAVGRLDPKGFHRTARFLEDFDGHLADVLGEHYRECVPIDGSFDGVAFGGILNMVFFYSNMTIAISRLGGVSAAPCRRQHKAEQQNKLFDCVVSHIYGVLSDLTLQLYGDFSAQKQFFLLKIVATFQTTT